MNNLKDFANDAVIKDLALECKQYRELIPRLCDDLMVVKKAHKEALEFNYDLAEENTAIHTKAIAMQERIAELEEEYKTLSGVCSRQGIEIMGHLDCIAALEEAHKANLHQEISTVQYTERGHRCSWRAAYEAVVQRSNSVLRAI